MYLKDCSLTVVTYSIICCYSNKAFLIIISNPRTLHGGSGALGSPGAIYFLTRNSLGALGSPGAIHYLTAKLSLSGTQGEALPHGEALSLSGTQGEALSGTIHSRRSPTSLRNGEALSLSGTISLKAKPYPSLRSPTLLCTTNALYSKSRWQIQHLECPLQNHFPSADQRNGTGGSEDSKDFVMHPD